LPPVTAHITGTVTKDDLPFPGVEVRAYGYWYNYNVVAMTDASGHYDLGVHEGSWWISFDSAPDFPGPLVAQSGLSLFVKDGQTFSSANIQTFSATGTISGTVKDAGASPLSNVYVYAVATLNDVELDVYGWTDSSGAYSLPVVDGEWSVSVGWLGYDIQEVSVSGSANADFEPFEATAHILGRVTIDGVGVTGASVWTQRSGYNGYSQANSVTDSNGNFDLGVLAGTWDITVSDLNLDSSHDWVFPELLTTAVADGQTVSGIVWNVVTATGTISGTVRAANNQPVSGMDVEGTCTVEGICYASYGNTDSNGAYSFPVIDGSWTVDVYEETGDTYDPQTVSVTGSAVVDFGPRLSTPPIIITTSPLAAGTVGAAYNQALSASGGTPPYTWSLAEGSSLPSGLSLGTDGVISGTPITAVSGIFTIQVTGNDNLSSTASFTLTITSPSATWQGTKFTPEEISAGNTGPTADFDQDGLPNLLEYAFRKNPKAHDAAGITPDVNANTMSISFPCDATCTDIIYTVQASSNLSAWEDIAESVGGAVTVPKNGSGCTISDTGTGLRPVTVTEAAPFTGRRFLRVRVSTP
jgi:hypothetical protein